MWDFIRFTPLYGYVALARRALGPDDLARDNPAVLATVALHPNEAPRVPYVTHCLREGSGPVVSASDYIKALAETPDLAGIASVAADSGEGRWTSIAAIEEGIPAPVLTASLYARFLSRGMGEFAFKVQSAQRKQFGGHDERHENAGGAGAAATSDGAGKD